MLAVVGNVHLFETIFSKTQDGWDKGRPSLCKQFIDTKREPRRIVGSSHVVALYSRGGKFVNFKTKIEYSAGVQKMFK